MGLNPTFGPSEKQLALREKVLGECFNIGSPYFDMYKCGFYGVPLDDCIDKCNRNGIAIRSKDIRSWEDGDFKRSMTSGLSPSSNLMTDKRSFITYGKPFDELVLEDFPKFPISWNGTSRRFFPCSSDNKPLGKWGWSAEYTPELYTLVDAKALSPVQWVGQNMLYQKFIVLDIDGVGHGMKDDKVIEWGSQFRSMTMTMEDPNKKGSFHLYFKTDRIIPVKHFPWAKLDLMGNAVNAAVYLKNKVSNGIEPAELTNEIWKSLIEYQKERNNNVSKSC